MNPLVSALVPLILTLSAQASDVWRVRAGAQPGGDGRSWGRAFCELESALALAQPGDQIWLAHGRYVPSRRSDPKDPRSARFLVRDVALHGGFVGCELSLAQRQGLAERTLLSGDLGLPGRTHDNACTVVAVNGSVRLERLCIQDGNADGALDQRGGGVECVALAGAGVQLVLDGCVLRDNRAVQGGALFAQLGQVRILRTRFERNVAVRGGALWAQSIRIDAQNVEFEGNLACEDGGAVYATSIAANAGIPWVHFTNALFAHNSARRGGAVFLDGGAYTSGKAAFHDCTLSANAARDSGGGIHAVTNASVPALLRLENTIVWGNSAQLAEPEIHGAATALHCLAPLAGDGCLYADPQFAPGTFVPGARSPAIDAGCAALLRPDALDLDGDGACFEALPLDLAGGERIAGLEVDVGAYEF